MLSPRQELLAIQKRLFKINQNIIKQSTLQGDRHLHRYQQRYLKAVADYKKTVQVEELKKSILAADIVLVGDYHTNRQSQRAFLRLLRQLLGEQRPFGICLEMIHRSKQKYVDQFLRDKIDEANFLKKIQLKKHFYFELWSHFKSIFTFAKQNNIPVYGLESAQSFAGLPKRDEAMAKTLIELKQQNPEKLLMVLVGDLHLVPAHLPKMIQKFGKSQHPKVLLIYQNSEKIYWKLAELGTADKIEIVQIDERSYCLMNTPPIVCQQSFLSWLDHEEAFDISDARHQFLELMEYIAQFLNLRIPDNKEDVEIFTWKDLSFLDDLEQEADFTQREIRQMIRKIESSESFYLEKRKWVYLGNLSLNHAAEQASICLKHLLAGTLRPRTGFDAFYVQVLQDALGFLGSKLFNHKRKCMRESDYETLAKYFRGLSKLTKKERLDFDLAKMLIAHQQAIRKNKDPVLNSMLFKSSDLFFGLSHALGQILGERIYHALMAKLISKQEIAKLFRSHYEGEEVAYLLVKQLLSRSMHLRLPQRL